MITYNKLIRDKIPEIMAAQGKKSDLRVLEKEEYLESLNAKLQEELNEYYEAQDTNELADMVEVIYAILEAKGVAIEEFENIRQKKKDIRGGFAKQLYLISVSEE